MDDIFYIVNWNVHSLQLRKLIAVMAENGGFLVVNGMEMRDVRRWTLQSLLMRLVREENVYLDHPNMNGAVASV